jgi:hypothetical protein
LVIIQTAEYPLSGNEARRAHLEGLGKCGLSLRLAVPLNSSTYSTRRENPLPWYTASRTCQTTGEPACELNVVSSPPAHAGIYEPPDASSPHTSLRPTPPTQRTLLPGVPLPPMQSVSETHARLKPAHSSCFLPVQASLASIASSSAHHPPSQPTKPTCPQSSVQPPISQKKNESTKLGEYIVAWAHDTDSIASCRGDHIQPVSNPCIRNAPRKAPQGRPRCKHGLAYPLWTPTRTSGDVAERSAVLVEGSARLDAGTRSESASKRGARCRADRRMRPRRYYRNAKTC